MFQQTLIDKCYDNSFGIDLKKYHRHICQISKDEVSLIDEISKSNRIIFNDYTSSCFELMVYDGLIYLIGDKTCYPCSNVVVSGYGSELNWVNCIVIPGTLKVKGETDIRNSSIIISRFSDIIPLIPNEKLFLDFLNKLIYTFSPCEWFKRIYSTSLYVRLAKFWDYRQKIMYLYDLGALYPLEFAIYTIYKQAEIRNEKILKFFIASLA